MQTRFAFAAALVLTPVFAAQAAEQASPARHANAEHPAVLVAHQAKVLNTNTYLVQPPAAVTWTVQSEPKLVAIVGTTGKAQ
ncbi:MAG: hypothetical protein KA375_01575 [Vitreoscilla sp.]|nr:hypothetical protein [Burkholderiales bacterium]MBP6336257.1 hypothetical protein [Vitreoscilla sp.]MBP6674652.1 hypothetical protein [Vitreoscilla sp.]